MEEKRLFINLIRIPKTDKPKMFLERSLTLQMPFGVILKKEESNLEISSEDQITM